MSLQVCGRSPRCNQQIAINRTAEASLLRLHHSYSTLIFPVDIDAPVPDSPVHQNTITSKRPRQFEAVATWHNRPGLI